VQYERFRANIQNREETGLQTRIDSMGDWGLDILYIVEEYDISGKSYLIKEYYFSSAHEDSIQTLKRKEKWRVYRPERYYENGQRVSKYFFRHDKAKEQLASIRNHMADRKPVDTIHAMVKKEVIHAGCGMSGRAVQYERDKFEKKYRKRKTPNYYLIETLLDSTEMKVSFQTPVEQKFEVIVEGHSF